MINLKTIFCKWNKISENQEHTLLKEILLENDLIIIYYIKFLSFIFIWSSISSCNINY
jgi:hypothetical protein